MSLAIRALFEPLRSLAYTSIDDTNYTAIGSAFQNPARQIYIQNTTDGLLCLSIDGVTDHLVVPADGFIVLDQSTNRTTEQGFFFAQNTTMYVRYLTAPTSGSIYLSIIHGFERGNS